MLLSDIYLRANELFSSFGDTIASNISYPLSLILSAGLMVHFSYVVIYHLVVQGKFMWSDSSIYIVKVTVFTSLLTSTWVGKAVVETIYQAVAILVFAIKTQDYQGLEHGNIHLFLSMMQEPINNVICLTQVIMDSYNPLKLISGAVILLIFSLLGARVLGALLELSLTLFFIRALFPVFVALFYFKVTTRISVKTVQFLGARVAYTIFAIMVMQLILFLLEHLMPSLMHAKSLHQYEMANWVNDYLTLFTLGIFAMVLMQYIKHFANYIFSTAMYKGKL